MSLLEEILANNKATLLGMMEDAVDGRVSGLAAVEMALNVNAVALLILVQRYPAYAARLSEQISPFDRECGELWADMFVQAFPLDTTTGT